MHTRIAIVKARTAGKAQCLHDEGRYTVLDSNGTIWFTHNYRDTYAYHGDCVSSARS